MTQKKKTASISFLSTLGVIILLNIVGQFFHKRFDFTYDKRYTLSDISKNIIQNIEKPLHIEIYLEGNFPSSFKKLQTEVRQLLEEYQAINNNVQFTFINPLTGDENQKIGKAEELYAHGMRPLNITVNERGKQSQEMVFPWGIAHYEDKKITIPLLKNTMAMSTEETINTSVQHLEYAISDAIQKAITKKDKKIAIIKGIGQPSDIEIADMLLSLRDSYYIAPFVLDSVTSNPKGTLEQLKQYDVILINKPNKIFTDAQIQVIDQYIINGGKAMLFMEEVQADMDSLQTRGQMLVYPKNNNLNDMLFKYGVRVNPVLVKDELGAPIKIAVGNQGSQTQYQEFVWKYSPIAYPLIQHPIVKNIEGVKYEYANSIDTLKNKVKKTILLQSSPYSKTIGTPTIVSLQMLGEETSPEEYQNKGNIPLAVLLEGDFTSTYYNRILPFEDKNFKKTGKNNKIIVVADGDIVRNQIDQNGQPMELGYDKWTNKLYGNKEFVINSINYLTDEKGLIHLRTKEVKLALLDKESIYKDYNTIQIILVIIPIVALLIFGILFVYIRKIKYTK